MAHAGGINREDTMLQFPPSPAPFLGTIEGGLYCAGLFAVVAIVALALDLLVRLLRRLRASEAVCRTLEFTALSLVVLDCIIVLGSAIAHTAHALAGT